jgi:hypothetical protein
VAQACNPKCFGGGDQEVGSLRSVGKKFSRDPISTNGWMWLYALSPRLCGEAQIEGSQYRPTQAYSKTVSKITNAKELKEWLKW